MFTNKHLIVAMLVAPALAIMAWFAVDYFVAERPHAAQEGTSYKLIAKSNCRYASGQCDLENGDFKLTLRPQMLAASSVALSMTSSHPLQSALLGLMDGEDEHAPTMLTATGSDGTEWQTLLPRPDTEEAVIRVAVTAQGATWFVEISTIWIEAEE